MISFDFFSHRKKVEPAAVQPKEQPAETQPKEQPASQ